ncbi:hypothetical protein EDB81DRAFT_885024 [Dactylonectria macrodidyma]|uniref:Uncharacterized protein n=1 Tax=Dactylonectria macrodidyma TaxID=307937 RepID=A0A9P9EQV3_9HYPO|nr:hypothetical protein EDB81DRAFT_885024 [Dactylonectria macrodidyma]
MNASRDKRRRNIYPPACQDKFVTFQLHTITVRKYWTTAEIAGLVLGAVPLLISELEHYEDFVEPMVAFLKWKGQLSKVTRRLLMGHTAYDHNVRLLLKQVVSNEDLVDMMDDPQSDD